MTCRILVETVAVARPVPIELARTLHSLISRGVFPTLMQRRYGGKPTPWLRRVFTQVEVSWMALSPVGLEQVYLEVTGASGAVQGPV